jgi:hypothetical protein
MIRLWRAAAIAALLSLLGCTASDQGLHAPSAVPPSVPQPRSVVANAPAPVSPPARPPERPPVGPLSEAEFLAVVQRAEWMFHLRLQQCAVFAQHDLLEVIDRDEEAYLRERHSRPAAPGAAARHLAAFRRARDDATTKLHEAEARLGRIEALLLEFDKRHGAPRALARPTPAPTPCDWDQGAADRPLSHLGLSDQHQAALAEHYGVRTVRQFALGFFPAERHGALAALLAVPKPQARLLVERAAVLLNEAELDTLTKPH